MSIQEFNTKFAKLLIEIDTCLMNSINNKEKHELMNIYSDMFLLAKEKNNAN